jgi:hypothetical protein
MVGNKKRNRDSTRCARESREFLSDSMAGHGELAKREGGGGKREEGEGRAGWP